MSNKANRSVYVFIDASNLWEAQKACGCFFDYRKLLTYLKAEYSTKSIKIFYYSAFPASGTRTFDLDGRHKFFTFLKKGLGFEVRKKPLKRIHIETDKGQSIVEKGNMDVEMTIDAIHNINRYDIAVFFTGDSDFLPLVSYIRNKDKFVYIFSSKNNVSQELRTGADGYKDVLELGVDVWGSKLRHRNQKS